MPSRTFLLLIVGVVASAGLTIALAVLLGINFVWLGLTAGLGALAVRKWM